MRKILLTLTMIFCLLGITPALAAQDEPYTFDTYPYMDNWGETEFGSWLDIPISDLESMSTEALLRSYLSNVDVLDWMYYGHVEDLEWIATELVPEYPLLKELFSRDDLTETLFLLYEDSYIYDSEEWEEMLSSPINTKEGWENRVKLWEQSTLEELMLLDQFANGDYTEDELATALQLLIDKNWEKEIAPDFYIGQSHFTWAYYAQQTDKLPDPLEYITKEYLYENTLPEDLDPVYLNQVDAYTPMGEKVTAFVRLDEMSQDEKDKLNLKFTNFEKLGEPTYRYNGFSYAFYSQDTTENRYWIDDISPYIEGNNPSYYKVNNVAKQDGDIVVLSAKDGKWLAAGVIKMNPPGSFHTWNILCKMGYGGAYNLTENAFKGVYRDTYSISYYRKVENNGFWEQEWPLKPILYDDEKADVIKIGTPENYSYVDFLKDRNYVPLAVIQSSSTLDLIKLLLDRNPYYYHELFTERDREQPMGADFADEVGKSDNKYLVEYKYFDPIIYELFRRDDFTEALFQAYESETINPCYIDRTKMRKLKAAIESTHNVMDLEEDETGVLIFPNGITTNDFNIIFDITRHGYLEHLMLLDQMANGLYTEEEKAELTRIFNKKNLLHQIDFALFGVNPIMGIYPAGGYYNEWECTLHGIFKVDEDGTGYAFIEKGSKTQWEKIPDFEGGGRLALSEPFPLDLYLSPDISNLERTDLGTLWGYKLAVTTPNGTPVQAFYDCRPKESIEEGIDISETRKAILNVELFYYKAIENVKTIGNPTWRYNCHSYAWFYRNQENPYRIDIVTPYIKDGSVSEVDIEYVQEGDIAGYYLKTFFRDKTIEELGKPLHSAVILSTEHTPKTTIVQSKWGEGYLLEHKLKTAKYYNQFFHEIRYFHCNSPVPTEPPAKPENPASIRTLGFY